MGRKKKRTHRKRKLSIVMTASAGAAGLYSYQAYQSGGAGAVAEAWTGFNPDTGTFSFWNARAAQTMLAGMIIKKVGTFLGAGRAMQGLPVGW